MKIFLLLFNVFNYTPLVSRDSNIRHTCAIVTPALIVNISN